MESMRISCYMTVRSQDFKEKLSLQLVHFQIKQLSGLSRRAKCAHRGLLKGQDNSQRKTALPGLTWKLAGNHNIRNVGNKLKLKKGKQVILDTQKGTQDVWIPGSWPSKIHVRSVYCKCIVSYLYC